MTGPFEYPPPAFYFTVSFGTGSEFSDTSFKEVSGLSSEIETEEVVEGGENRFVHQLPKKVKHQRLVVKRGTTDASSKLVKWCKETLENGFEKPIESKLIQVSLLNEKDAPLRTWSFDRAYPVKWEVDSFESTKNEVVLETIEFVYAAKKREL